MKPKIYYKGGRWILLCRRRLRSFSTFGLSAQERQEAEYFPEYFNNWKDAVNALKYIYKQRQIIR